MDLGDSNEHTYSSEWGFWGGGGWGGGGDGGGGGGGGGGWRSLQELTSLWYIDLLASVAHKPQ